MDKEIARSLLPLVNDKEYLDKLIEYAEHRIALHHKNLEIAKTFEEVQKIQGSIRELKFFHTLRDEVTTRSKE